LLQPFIIVLSHAGGLAAVQKIYPKSALNPWEEVIAGVTHSYPSTNLAEAEDSPEFVSVSKFVNILPGKHFCRINRLKLRPISSNVRGSMRTKNLDTRTRRRRGNENFGPDTEDD
jgi:hypothetical protein